MVLRVVVLNGKFDCSTHSISSRYSRWRSLDLLVPHYLVSGRYGVTCTARSGEAQITSISLYKNNLQVRRG